ncbi:MAG: sulfotransferase [Schleiferiaceae bacterium]|nr:sulfotransferase [Schleiferiaceae bacterium]
MDYFVVGAQKSATTWLYVALGKQYSFQQLPIKELHFWDALQVNFSRERRLPHKRLYNRFQSIFFWETIWEAVKSRKYNWFSLKFYSHYLFRTYDVNWYLGFQELTKQKLVGDFTPAYAFLKRDTISLMQSKFPKAKVFFIVRDPIERLWSQWRMYVRVRGNGDVKEYTKTVQDFSAFQQFFQKEGLDKRCDYHSTIINYSKCYGNQFYMGFYDDILTDPHGFLNEICGILTAQANIETVQALPLKVNDSFYVPIPDETNTYLKEQLEKQYLWLSETFDGHPALWYQRRYGVQYDLKPIRDYSYFIKPSEYLLNI